MTIRRRKFQKGIRIKKENIEGGTGAEDLTLDGEIGVDANDNKVKVRLNGSTEAIVTEDQAQTLTNKTFDANGTGNSISNIETADLASGVLITDISTASSDTELPSALAVKTALAGQNEASEITYSNATSGLTAVQVQAAIDEVEGRLDTAESNITTSQGTADDHIADATDAHAASAITNTPTGNLAATNVQTALDELQSDVDTRTLETGGSLITPVRSDVKQDTDANLVTYASTAANGQLCFATDTKKMYQVIDGLLKAVGGSGTAFEVTQASHGLTLGSGVYHNGTIYVDAKADAEGTLAYHVVIEVIDANTIVLADFGRVEATAHGFTVGQYYFQSEATAGLPVTTEPSTGFSNPLFYVEDANTLQIKCLRPSPVGDAIALDELSDVSVPSPTDGQGLVYNNANTRWEALDIATQAEIDAHAADTSTHGVSVIAGTTEVQQFTAKDYEGGFASNTSRITIPKNTKLNLDGLTRKEATIVYASDDKKAYIDNGTDLVGLGSGNGFGINYITNSDAELNADGYTSYRNTTDGVSPDDFLGTPDVGYSGIVSSTSLPLRGSRSFILDLTMAIEADAQGHGSYYSFSVDAADLAKKLTISFDYDTSDVLYNDDDLRIFIYDEDKSQFISVNGEGVKGGKNTHLAQFQTDAASDNYRLGFHYAGTSKDFAIKLDNIQVGPRDVVKGAAMTDSKDFTPVISGATLGTTNYAKYWRVGQNMIVKANFTITSPLASQFKIEIPSSLSHSIDVGTNVVGSLGTSYTGYAKDLHAIALAADLTNIWVGIDDAADITSGVNANTFLTTGNTVTLEVTIPIQGWSSNAVMSSDLGGREIVVEGAGNSGTALTANTTDIDFTEVRDTTASWDGSIFTAPETGEYEMSGYVFATASAIQYMDSYVSVDGAAFALKHLVTYETAANRAVKFYDKVKLNKGDRWSLRSEDTATLSNSVANHYIHIQKLASPQTILETETVAARYTSNSGQSFADGASDPVLYEDLVTDTHNAYNTTTGIYTVPTSGWYTYTGLITFSSTRGAGELAALRCRVNNVIIEESINEAGVADTQSTFISCKCSGEIYLEKNDELFMEGHQTIFTSIVLNASSYRNIFSIARIK